MSEKNIYLVRHGEIQAHNLKAYIGVLDIPLSDNGKKNCRRLTEFFKDISVDRIYCSNLKRTFQTSSVIAENRNLSIIKLQELNEINMGSWEGKTFEEIKVKFPLEFESRIKILENFKPPYGESFRECQKRVFGKFKEITMKDNNENIIIVGHAGVNRVILASILRIPIKDIFSIKQEYTCINKITFDGLNYKIIYINNTL